MKPTGGGILPRILAKLFLVSVYVRQRLFVCVILSVNKEMKMENRQLSTLNGRYEDVRM